jgi:hypothetical protein
MYKDTKKLEYEIYDHTGNMCSQRKSNKEFKEKFGSPNRDTFKRFTTADSHTGNIENNTGNTAG